MSPLVSKKGRVSGYRLFHQHRLPRVVNACLKFIDKESEICECCAKGQLGRERQARLSLKSPLLRLCIIITDALGKVWAGESRLQAFSQIWRWVGGSWVGIDLLTSASFAGLSLELCTS